MLSRHSLGFFVSATGLDRRLPFLTPPGHDRRDEPYTNPEHLRLALEQLGSTFVKLGQILSTRPELRPPEYQSELAWLQDSAPLVAESLVSDIIRQELGLEPEEVFATFDKTPLASASIGQAHAATLADGTERVVKIRRPGVVEQSEVDLEVLQNLPLTPVVIGRRRPTTISSESPRSSPRRCALNWTICTREAVPSASRPTSPGRPEFTFPGCSGIPPRRGC